MLKQPKLPLPLVLPNELWMHVFSLAPSKTLQQCRLVNQEWKSMANIVLAKRLAAPLAALKEQSAALNQQYKQMLATKTPHLNHYQEFLVQAAQSDISEVIWYNTPPPELSTVCECLVRLRDPGLAVIPGPLSWSTIKRTMSKYEFKTWFVNLRNSVKTVQMKSVTDVENIIRSDPLITYERLRDVSMAGYRLLIQIAAALQHCNIENELRVLDTERAGVDLILHKTTEFYKCL